LLLDACALLRQRSLPFRCLMLGDGPLRAQLVSHRDRLGLSSVVEMAGAATQADVLRAWQRAALGVLTSHNEGMPVSLMEAAACGVPVVATRVGGIPELVRDGVTGLLCRAGDVADLAEKMERLLCHAPLRSRMAHAARTFARERFSVRLQVDSLMDVWSRALKEAAA